MSIQGAAMRGFVWVFLVLSSILILSPQLALTQESCPELIVEEALNAIGPNCSAMDLNTACYGYNRVNATRRQPGGPDFFSQPNARAQLAALATIQTAPNEQGLGWGVAVMSLQANDPDSVPGQAINFLLLGGTEVENAVEPWEATRSREMAFYFRPGFGPASCSAVPNAIAVRAPEDVTIDLNANGAHVRLGSTAIMRVLPPGNTMQVFTVEGTVILDADTPEQLTVPPGFSTLRCLGEPGDLGIDGNSNDRVVTDTCTWTTPTPADAELIALGAAVDDLFGRLGGSVCENGGQDVVHVVRRGENLFRIARRYTTTVQAITEANGIANAAAIFPGQELLIACAIDTGASTFPPVILIPVTAPLTSSRP
jgi:hypothetical protein